MVIYFLILILTLSLTLFLCHQYLNPQLFQDENQGITIKLENEVSNEIIETHPSIPSILRNIVNKMDKIMLELMLL